MLTYAYFPIVCNMLLLIRSNTGQTVDKQFHYVGMRPIAASEGNIWPEPQQQSVTEQFWQIRPSNFRFEYKGYPCSIIDIAIARYRTLTFRPVRSQQFSSKKRMYSWQPEYPAYTRNLNSVSVHLRGQCEEWPYLGMDEKYEHNVNASGAFITAWSVWGILKGLETFSQLVCKDNSGEHIIQYTDIMDYPRFAHRGILLDTSRHFIPKHILLDNLDAMAYNKFNVFHWHIVDDQSFPYQSIQFPLLSEMGAYNSETHIYTPKDIADIVEYARERGIRVIPEFGTPAHTFSWGHGVPEIMTKCYKNGQEIPNWHGPFNPLLGATYQFLEKLFKEITGLFPDQYIHLGGDEVTYNCWKSNPDIQAFMKNVGFDADYRKLLNYYFTGLLHRLTLMNRKLQYILWQEVFDEGVQIPFNSIIQIWKGNELQKLSDVTSRGYSAILSSNWYLNRVSSNSDWKTFYKIEPLRFTGSDEQKKLVIGGEACMWGELVDGSNLMSRLWPRASAVAERLWSRQEVNNPELAAPRLEEHRCRMVRRGINAEPQNGPNYCDADNLL